MPTGLSKVTVVKGSSGLGRRLLSNDGVSAIIFYNGTLPSGFGVNDRVKLVNSLQEAETLGITDAITAHEVEHYQISEFFRANPSGQLWLGYYAVPVGAPDFVEVSTVQAFARGAINLFGVYLSPDRVYTDTDVEALQIVMNAINALNQPAVAYLCEDLAAVVDGNIATLSDLRTKNAPDVSVLTHQDGAGTGLSLFTAKGYSVQALGAVLGKTSAAPVQESPAYPEKYNLTGNELTEPAFGNGTLNKALAVTVLDALINRGYTILRDYLPNLSGVYVERVPMAVALTSDYAYQENRRVVQKAQRLLVASYLPKLNSNILLNDDGTIADPSLEALKDVGASVLDSMKATGNISNGVILIDGTQNVVSTSELVISAQILPLATAQYITVNINLVPTL
jgi:hypothetical protein